MTIKRDDIDRRIVDFSEVASGRRLPLIHPGEILREANSSGASRSQARR